MAEPVTLGDVTIATIDDEGTIVNRVIAPHHKYGYNAYLLDVKLDYGSILQLRVLHESAEYAYEEALSRLANKARQPRKHRYWKDFWDLRNAFNQIRYSYALTAHRSQGSTFKTVFVDKGDILANPQKNDALRCLYVACTRATTRLVVR